MWVFTVDGFFSVGENVGISGVSGLRLLVRSRSLIEMKRFLGKMGILKKTNIVSLANADYRHRVVVDREVWAKYLKFSAEAIDYSNFKDAVRARRGLAAERLVSVIETTMKYGSQG